MLIVQKIKLSTYHMNYNYYYYYYLNFDSHLDIKFNIFIYCIKKPNCIPTLFFFVFFGFQIFIDCIFFINNFISFFHFTKCTTTYTTIGSTTTCNTFIITSITSIIIIIIINTCVNYICLYIYIQILLPRFIC